MSEDELQQNIRSVLDKVQKAGGGNVKTVAATKTVDVDLINKAIDFGITDIGENRVQEFVGKAPKIKNCTWHFIGSLQRNKVKYLVGNVELIQSVGSMAVADEVNWQAQKKGVPQQILVELNVGDEENKTGAKTFEINSLISHCLDLPFVLVRGLMAIPPIGASDDIYKKAYKIFSDFRSKTFDILSMGMSDDYEKAIGFGSNMVRIGRVLFGARRI